MISQCLTGSSLPAGTFLPQCLAPSPGHLRDVVVEGEHFRGVEGGCNAERPYLVLQEAPGEGIRVCDVECAPVHRHIATHCKIAGLIEAPIRLFNAVAPDVHALQGTGLVGGGVGPEGGAAPDAPCRQGLVLPAKAIWWVACAQSWRHDAHALQSWPGLLAKLQPLLQPSHVTCNVDCTHDRIGSHLDPKPLSAAVTQAGACPQVVALHKPYIAWEGRHSPTWAQQPGNHFQILSCVAAICSSPIPPGHAAVGLLGEITGQHGAVLSQLSSWRSPIPPGAGHCCLPWAQ